MNNLSIVDYLKKAAGFNNQDSGRMERRNISPWAQSPISTNQYPSPNINNFNAQHVSRPPPPPMFRQDRAAPPPRNFPFGEDVSRTPFDTPPHPYFDSREYRSSNTSWRNTNPNGRIEQPYNSPRERSENERYRSRYENGRNRHFDKRAFSAQKRYQESEQRHRSSIVQERTMDKSDVECISIVGHSPSETLSDVSVASPDITEIPIEMDSPSYSAATTSRQGRLKDGVSHLERAYNRRISTNSDTSEISVVPNTDSNMNSKSPIDNASAHRTPEAYYTPASPDR